MVKTLVEKITSPRSGVTIFKISGTLGYHENEVLNKFFSECSRRGIRKLVMDFSSLGSLGGGCADILRREASRGNAVICVAGASSTVRNFLTRGGPTPILFESDVDDAVDRIVSLAGGEPKRSPEPARLPDEEREDRVVTAPDPPASNVAATESGGAHTGESTDPLPFEQPVSALADDAEDPPESAGEGTEAMSADASGVPMAGGARFPDRPAARRAPRGSDGGEADDRELKRKLVQYRALFSLNSDFSRIRDKARLLDAFLLSSIAQVGVESAAFLERRGEAFVAVAWKGFETAHPEGLRVEVAEVDLAAWADSPGPRILDETPLVTDAKIRLERWGLPFAAPFLVHNDLRGIVLFGKPIRRRTDHDTGEFLSILIHQAAIAYENTCRFEAESERTLGLVHSLITMIEENTMSRGNTEVIVAYTYAVAVAAHYPEEHIRDLIYGTVLRDIGMIKVSDLIVRSPRELQKEEWEIIKRHPQEGTEMLEKMGFSAHTREVVLHHHERFNGDGYPKGIQGAQIALGARIVSVVESYVAMINDRPTRPALRSDEALHTLRENWGMRYDPDIVKVFVEIVEEEMRSGRKVSYKASEYFKL